ncbi:MAG: hypothetical protein JWN33_84 [Candidatus Saccharibacteria bacterium]|nr:hypothetical protein [Candidatus Saccharibacteria bacterium]
MEKLHTRKFDLISQEKERLNEAHPYINSSVITLSLGAAAMKFARVERVPRYEDSEQENDAEHSFMLALVATELADALYHDRLNPSLVSQYAIVHDLIELKTGDVATLTLNTQELADKEKNEHDALESLLRELPPYTARLLRAYEAQSDPEARFVRMVDKLLPLVVDIIGDGERVMREDFDITTTEQLQRCHVLLHRRIAESFPEFPELVEDHALLCELFEVTFQP